MPDTMPSREEDRFALLRRTTCGAIPRRRCSRRCDRSGLGPHHVRHPPARQGQLLHARPPPPFGGGRIETKLIT
jgi:hypothetical protein